MFKWENMFKCSLVYLQRFISALLLFTPCVRRTRDKSATVTFLLFFFFFLFQRALPALFSQVTRGEITSAARARLFLLPLLKMYTLIIFCRWVCDIDKWRGLVKWCRNDQKFSRSVGDSVNLCTKIHFLGMSPVTHLTLIRSAHSCVC